MKSGKMDTFRSCYSRLADPDMRKTIESSLGMSDATRRIGVSPERTNIKYWVVDTQVKDPQVQYGWLIKELQLHGQATSHVEIFFITH